jgi:hypothetical protein
MPHLITEVQRLQASAVYGLMTDRGQPPAFAVTAG